MSTDWRDAIFSGDKEAVAQAAHEMYREIRYLRSRLHAAESVAALVGFGPADDSDHGKALHEVWSFWSGFPGVSTDPESYPHLDDAALKVHVERRDRTRERTLRRIRGEAS